MKRAERGGIEAALSSPGFARQLRTVIAALAGSPVVRRLKALAVAIVVVVAATAYGQILLNRWNKPFYDALARRDFPEFIAQLGVFCVIAGTLLVLNVAQRWLVESLKLRLREALVKDLVGRWLEPRRAFWLAGAGPIGVNPDQRMHDDTLKLCELSADLGVGLLQASVLLGSFAGILWAISSGFAVRIGGVDYAVPGYMLWAALLYSGVGSLLSLRVGRVLIVRNAERYAREADLRFALVRVNEHLDGISLAGGEPDERRRVEGILAELLAATRRLVRGITDLTWVTAGFGWTALIAPTLVAAPLYLTGKITFGGLMMAAAAFTQAQTSLRWFVDNFSQIAEWRATLLRVATFRLALLTPLEQPGAGERIAYDDAPAGTLTIDGLVIPDAAGSLRLEPEHVVIRSPERVVVAAAPGVDKTLLFRALDGLRPWGRGRIGRPADEAVLYMPRGTPYLPTGSLRDALCYPLAPRRFDDRAVRDALERLGLARLVPELDVVRRWDRELGIDEQLALAFARARLHAPAWLVIDGGLGALDAETRARAVDVFEHELAGTAIIHIGAVDGASGRLFARELRLVRATAAPSPVPAAGDDRKRGEAS